MCYGLHLCGHYVITTKLLSDFYVPSHKNLFYLVTYLKKNAATISYNYVALPQVVTKRLVCVCGGGGGWNEAWGLGNKVINTYFI